MSKYLFISKDFNEVELLASFLSQKGITLIAQSFLHFEPVPFTVEKPFDVIFFSSPRSVLFFRLLYKIPENTLIACPGNKTAELLSNLGYKVDFIGERSGNINENSEAFKKWCGDKKVLFPSSDKSLQSFASNLSENQKEIVTVYETKIVSKPLEYCDIYVFTSPSNVEGFLNLNKIPTQAKVYSWGESTTSFLEKKGITVTKTLGNSSIEDLINLLK